MTGPVEYEYRRPFRCGAVRRRRGVGMSVDVVTFGCRLNAAESEVIRREAERGRLERYGRGQYLRGHRGSGAPGAADDPRAAPRARRRRRSWSPAARRRPSRDTFAAMAEADRVLGNARSSDADAWARTRRFRRRDAPKALVDDIMAVKDDRAASDRRFCRPRARLRAGAERLRSPLHLLHHSVRPRQFALGADGRGRRAGAAARRQRLWRSGAHRRRYHQLRRGSAGRAEARRAGQADPQARAGAHAAAACPRSIRSRPIATCSMRSPATRG